MSVWQRVQGQGHYGGTQQETYAVTKVPTSGSDCTSMRQRREMSLRAAFGGLDDRVGLLFRPRPRRNGGSPATPGPALASPSSPRDASPSLLLVLTTLPDRARALLSPSGADPRPEPSGLPAMAVAAVAADLVEAPPGERRSSFRRAAPPRRSRLGGDPGAGAVWEASPASAWDHIRPSMASGLSDSRAARPFVMYLCGHNAATTMHAIRTSTNNGGEARATSVDARPLYLIHSSVRMVFVRPMPWKG